MTMTTMREQHQYDVFDALAGAPNGLTIDGICTATGLSRGLVLTAVFDIRREFENDDVNLVADSPGTRDPWVYRLVGDPHEARKWLDNRRRDLHTRLRTAEAVCSSLVNATDGRSREGQWARRAHRNLKYLREELEDILGANSQ